MDENDVIELDDGTTRQKKKLDGKYRRMRNLGQYKDLSDEEFQQKMENKAVGIEQSREFEERIAKKWSEFDNDYDLSDMKINDRDTLRALIQAQINLEDYEQYLFKLRREGISENTIFSTEKFQKVMSDLRADISKLQNDLNITRKVRNSDKDVSVLAYITDLKEKAKKYYESRMNYIFCPKCNMQLGTVWVMFPEETGNRITLVCGRTMPDGSKCGEKITIGIKDLIANRGTSNKEITPESML